MDCFPLDLGEEASSLGLGTTCGYCQCEAIDAVVEPEGFREGDGEREDAQEDEDEEMEA